MSETWYMISNPLNLSGYESDEFLNSAEQGFSEMLQSFIGTDVTVYNRIADAGVTCRVIIQNETTDVVGGIYNRQILAPIGTLRCGQYVKTDKGYWLIHSLPDDNGMYEKALMWFCKSKIKLTVGSSVIEYPVYSTNSTQYGSGITNKSQMSVPSAQHLVYIANDPVTANIESGYRFIMGGNINHPVPYEITQVDYTSYSADTHGGVLQWSVEADQFRNGKDQSANMIADNTANNSSKEGW